MLICGLLGMCYAVYCAFTCFGGFFRAREKRPDCKDITRFAVIVAARNEETVIGDLIRSLKAQRYPEHLFDIYSVPNNCTDQTERVARKAGAKILRCAGEVATKGEALRQAFTWLTEMELYDAYCVFDADNFVDPMFLHHANNARQAGYHVAQGFRDSRNPYDSWVSGASSVFFWFMSRFFNESRARLGLSCHLNGTGFMVSDAFIRDIGWNTNTLTEDLELTGLCAIHDYKIGWMPDARVYDEQPISFRDSAIQRRRWTSGSLQCMRRYAARLIAKGSPSSVDAGCLFAGNLLNYVGLLSGTLTIMGVIRTISSGTGLPPQLPIIAAVYIVGCWIACSAAAAVMLRLEKKLCARSMPSVVLFPAFLFSWMIINLIASLTRPPKWKTIPHMGNSVPHCQ